VVRIQQDPRLTANRSKSVNSSIAEEDTASGYVGHVLAQSIDKAGTWDSPRPTSYGHTARPNSAPATPLGSTMSA